MTKLKEGEYGKPITYTCYDENGELDDLSSSTSRAFRLKPPSGPVVQVTATFVTDGTDGALTYSIGSGVLRPYGWWSLQPVVTYAAKSEKYDEVEFYVEAAI